MSADESATALQQIVDDAYGPAALRAMDIIGREDFYGIVAGQGLRFFADKLQLTAASHLLELGSGIGGPARFFARSYGCKVTGIDLSHFNHRTAVERTTEAGLGHLATFVHGDAAALSFPGAAFTHVFLCEALCYFPDKTGMYRSAHRALKPGGILAFLEAAADQPVRLRTEELLGPVRYESVARYRAMLEAAGFINIEHYNTTELASRDVSRSLYRLIANREQVIAAAGEEVYFGLLELWAEFIACFGERVLTHCGFVARKP